MTSSGGDSDGDGIWATCERCRREYLACCVEDGVCHECEPLTEGE
jgi:hypothetical protein